LRTCHRRIERSTWRNNNGGAAKHRDFSTTNPSSHNDLTLTSLQANWLAQKELDDYGLFRRSDSSYGDGKIECGGRKIRSEMMRRRYGAPVRDDGGFLLVLEHAFAGVF
jgi:hypothetical protein